MIFCNDFSSAAVIENKVFYVVQKVFRIAQSIDKIFQACTAFPDRLSVGIFLFALYFQPFKEKFIPCGKASQAGFHPVGQYADLVIMEQVRNIFQVTFQVDVIGILHRNIAVFQFNKYHRKTVDKKNQIRSAPMCFAFYPHLRGNRKGVI